MKRKNIKSILGILLALVLFVIFSQLTQYYEAEIKDLIINDYYGMFAYVFLMIFETIVAPMSFIPLIGVGSALWGTFIVGLLNWIAWIIGSVIVFYLSRKYGRELIGNLVSLEKIHEIESYVPKENIIISLILWRMVLPVDLLNYALGLFSNISFRIYLFTGIIGLIPLAFGLAYIGSLQIIYQVLGLLIGIVILLIGIELSKKNKRNKKLSNLKDC